MYCSFRTHWKRIKPRSSSVCLYSGRNLVMNVCKNSWHTWGNSEILSNFHSTILDTKVLLYKLKMYLYSYFSSWISTRQKCSADREWDQRTVSQVQGTVSQPTHPPRVRGPSQNLWWVVNLYNPNSLRSNFHLTITLLLCEILSKDKI